MSRRKMPASFAAMMADALGDDDEATPYAIPEAQRDELNLMVASYQAPARPFERGEFVAWKHGLGDFNTEAREKMVTVFWRYLDLGAGPDSLDSRFIEDMNAASTVAISNPDCLLGYINPDTGRLNFSAADSHALMLVPLS